MALTGFSNSNKVRLASGLITAAPVTFACWFYASGLGSFKTLLALCNSGAAIDRNFLGMKATSSNTISAEVGTGAGSYGGASVGTISAGWNHACAIHYDSTNRAAFANGEGKGTSADNRSPSGINRLSFGSQDNAGSGQPIASGDMLAEVGIWDVALTDEEVASLGKGIVPALIRPQSLVLYAPLVRTLYDAKGNALSIIGSLSVSDHPRIYGVS